MLSSCNCHFIDGRDGSRSSASRRSASNLQQMSTGNFYHNKALSRQPLGHLHQYTVLHVRINRVVLRAFHQAIFWGLWRVLLVTRGASLLTAQVSSAADIPLQQMRQPICLKISPNDRWSRHFRLLRLARRDHDKQLTAHKPSTSRLRRSPEHCQQA